jgi:casein kinase II subunit alpha
MGRPVGKSVARVYADVNEALGPDWHEYGALPHSLRPAALNSPLAAHTDNLKVQWGSQDTYEIVRKVGRGKYSEVRLA